MEKAWTGLQARNRRLCPPLRHHHDDQEAATAQPTTWMMISEAAEYAHVNVTAIKQAIADGSLRRGGTARRILLKRAWVDAWLRERGDP